MAVSAPTRRASDLSFRPSAWHRLALPLLVVRVAISRAKFGLSMHSSRPGIGAAIPAITSKAEDYGSNPQVVKRRILLYGMLAGVLFVCAYPAHRAAWRGDSELHTLFEAISALLAITSGVLALVRFHAKKNSSFLLLGSCFLGAGVIDAYHAIITSSFLAGYTPSALCEAASTPK
jgi:hypothetical protein